MPHGSHQISGSVSYASQESWLFAGTVKENILFGCTFENARFWRVVKVCGLLPDFEQFPHAEETMVNERVITKQNSNEFFHTFTFQGSNLSGGQKARVNLARCVYRDADIYLLDDPICAVDNGVAKNIVRKCVFEFLGEKTVIFSSHQRQFAKCK